MTLGSSPTSDDVGQIIESARARAPGAALHVTGVPLYAEGIVCSLVGEEASEVSDALAREAAANPMLDVSYPGQFGPLSETLLSPGDATQCHANTEGENLFGQQALDFWG